MAQWVKGLVSLLWLWSLMWCRFDPWSGNFYMLWAQPKKKKKKKIPVPASPLNIADLIGLVWSFGICLFLKLSR